MACTLFLKGFEENAGMAAPGWALTGKIAAGAAQCRFLSAASRRCVRQRCLQNCAGMNCRAAI